jgi:hypothetical protein
MSALVLDTANKHQVNSGNGLLSPPDGSPHWQQPPSPPPPNRGDDEEEEGDDKSDPNEEQNQAIQRILQLKKDDYRNILGVQDKYDTPSAEQEDILNAARKLGTLIHPEFIKGNNTRKAYNSE